MSISCPQAFCPLLFLLPRVFSLKMKTACRFQPCLTWNTQQCHVHSQKCMGSSLECRSKSYFGLSSVFVSTSCIYVWYILFFPRGVKIGDRGVKWKIMLILGVEAFFELSRGCWPYCLCGCLGEVKPPSHIDHTDLLPVHGFTHIWKASELHNTLYQANDVWSKNWIPHFNRAPWLTKPAISLGSIGGLGSICSMWKLPV